jgi:cyclic beta-1,2-glucan synthetase
MAKFIYLISETSHLQSPTQSMYKSQVNSISEKEILPLRAELYSKEQLKQHALHLAQTFEISREKSNERLLKELADNEKDLNIVISQLQQALKDKKEITPAGEWLLDNYYLIEEQIRIAQKYLPKNFSQSLPKLGNSAFAGYPRVYALLLNYLHTVTVFSGLKTSVLFYLPTKK